MKQRNIAQIFTEPLNFTTGNNNSSGKVSETFNLPATYSLGKTGQLQPRPNDFYDLNTGVQVFKHDTTLFPVIKMNSVSAAFKPVFNDYLKQTAARLSEIEMDIDCYNVSNLQFSTHALRELFFNMRMPAVCHLAVQMEELARKYQLPEVKDLLRAIKKIIGQVVKHSEKQRD